MSVTLISAPQKFAPAYNPMVYVFDSTNKNLPGFKYEIQLLLNDLTVVKKVLVSPRIGDGLGLFDVGKALQSYLTNERPDSQNEDAVSSYIGYRIQICEVFSASWDFDRWDLISGSSNSNRILLTSSVAHSFEAGDSIFAELDVDPNPNPFFSLSGIPGFHVVYDVPNSFSIVLPYLVTAVGDPGPGDSFGGKITFSNKGSLPSSSCQSLLGPLIAFNAAWSFDSFPSFDIEDITLNNVEPNKDLLTTLPSVFTVSPETQMVINIPYTEDGDPQGVPAGVVFFNDDETRTVELNGPFPITTIGVGPANLDSGSWVGGSAAITDAASYKFHVYNVGLSRLSNIYEIKIDRSCSRFPKKEILFLDRKGSLGSFYFSYLSKAKTSINRGVATFTNGEYIEPFYKGGKSVLGVSVETTIDLNTAWLTVPESIYFQELLSTPMAYMKDENGTITKVVVTNTSAERRLGFDNKNIRYSITVQSANNNMINW